MTKDNKRIKILKTFYGISISYQQIWILMKSHKNGFIFSIKWWKDVRKFNKLSNQLPIIKSAKMNTKLQRNFVNFHLNDIFYFSTEFTALVAYLNFSQTVENFLNCVRNCVMCKQTSFRKIFSFHIVKQKIEISKLKRTSWILILNIEKLFFPLDVCRIQFS